jgi:ankyrin repeat protein
LEVVRYLVMEALVDVNKAKNGGCTPLHIAALQGHIDIIKCLMHYAALLDVMSGDGLLPIDVALNEDVLQAFNDEEKRRRDHGFKRAVLTDGLQSAPLPQHLSSTPN